MKLIHPKSNVLKELNFKIFKNKGFVCVIARVNPMGNLNGYVGVDKNHKLYNKNYYDLYEIDFNVHWGLTYSDNKLAYFENEVFGDLWWFGFDTCHDGDLISFEDDRWFDEYCRDEYRDFDYVEKNVKKLAEKLYEIQSITIR